MQVFHFIQASTLPYSYIPSKLGQRHQLCPPILMQPHDFDAVKSSAQGVSQRVPQPKQQIDP
jgi:hypothetical protein